MNVLQVISSSRSLGAEKHIVVLSDRLRRRGHQVTVVCPPTGWITRQLSVAEVPRLEWRMHGLVAPATVLRIRSYVRQYGIEIIHTHLTRAAYMGYIAGLLGSNRHNSALSVRAELGVPADARLVAVFGRVDESKGQHILVQAASKIVQECPQAYFVFVGHADPAIQQGLWEVACQSGVGDRLRFTGVRDDVARLMDAMDVVALPSPTEACSMAIIEAMTLGKPVVATRAGGNPELIQDGVTGYLTARDPAAVGSAIVSLCRDRDLRATMGAAARERALALFTADRMAANMEALYQDVLRAENGEARNG